MEKIITKKVIEEVTKCWTFCSRCEAKITGASEGRTRANLLIHKNSKGCKNCGKQ